MGKLKDVAEIVNGRNQSGVESPDGIYPIYGSAGNLMGRATSYLCAGGSTIIGRKGNISTPIYINEPFWNVDTAFGLSPKSGNDSKFLFYLYQTIDFKSRNRGTTIPSLVKSDLLEIEVPIIPLPEQRRIVAVLDEAFAAIDRARELAERNLRNARELFESYLQGVFEGSSDGWQKTPLKEVCSKIGSGATPRGGQENYKSEGIGLVRSMNVHDWEFREYNLAFIDEQQAAELNGVTLQENDVLLNITGASIARCCIFPKEYLPARVNQHVSIIRPQKNILDPFFLNLVLTSKPYKDLLLSTGEQGATRQAITKAQIEAFEIAIPSHREQKSIVQRINNLRTETQRLEAIYRKKLTDLAELKKNVLEKAFRGELVGELEKSH